MRGGGGAFSRVEYVDRPLTGSLRCAPASTSPLRGEVTRSRFNLDSTCGNIRIDLMTAQSLKLDIANAASVSALLLRPENARACFVFAHGAGAGMAHPFMETVATGLCDRSVATLRYQFPYME